MKVVMLRVVMDVVLFIGRERTLADVLPFGAIREDRCFRQTGAKDLNHGIARRSIFQDQVGDHSNRAVAIASPRPSWPRHDKERRRDGYCKYAGVLQHWVSLACVRYRNEADNNLITKPETPYPIRSSWSEHFPHATEGL